MACSNSPLLLARGPRVIRCPFSETSCPSSKATLGNAVVAGMPEPLCSFEVSRRVPRRPGRRGRCIVVVVSEYRGGDPARLITRRRAAEYVRMSTEHQKYSTENQADAIRQYAARARIDIVQTYADEGKSGLSIDGRDALKQPDRRCRAGRADFKTILVYDVSRWGRFQDADESAYYEYICKRAGITSTTAPSSSRTTAARSPPSSRASSARWRASTADRARRQLYAAGRQPRQFRDRGRTRRRVTGWSDGDAPSSWPENSAYARRNYSPARRSDRRRPLYPRRAFAPTACFSASAITTTILCRNSSARGRRSDRPHEWHDSKPTPHA